MEAPSLDQLRLLYIIHRYAALGPNGRSTWMKELNLSFVVYHAIKRGVFDDYDWAPSLVEFHGVKMYGKVSQEANADLRRLQTAQLIDKLHLSTCLYDTIRAYRATDGAPGALAVLPEEVRRSLEDLLSCRRCETLREVIAFVEQENGGAPSVTNRSVHFCPRCCAVERTLQGRVVRGPSSGASVVDFFELAHIDYRTRGVAPGEWL